MSSSEDKCEVSEDKHKDRRKMESFREMINSTKEKKERGIDLGGYIMSQSQGREEKDS